MKFIFLPILIFTAWIMPAQIGGKATYKFLNLSISAKQAALGGKVYTGLKNDIFQPAFNPATLDSTLNNHLGANYADYLSDISYGNIAYARQFKNIGTLYAAVSYINYGRFDYADVNGERNGTFGASESALILGYAYRIPSSHWRIGANTKFILSALQNYTSTGLAFDFGLLYQNDEKGIATGLTARNLGWQLTTYQGTKESLPFEVDLTFAKTFLHAPFKWFVTFENIQTPEIAFVNTAHSSQDPNGNVISEDISFTDHFFRHLIIGLELFPRKRFNLRAGYNFRRGAELSQKDERFGSGLNFGFGLRLKKFEINYAYSNYHYAAGTNFISITVNLNEF